MQSPTVIVEQMINNGMPLSAIEQFVTVFSPSLEEGSPWFGIKAAHIDTLLKWRGAQGKWICMRQDGDFFMIGLLMPPTANLPASRCYYADVSLPDILNIMTEFPEIQLMSEDAFNEAVDVKNFRTRLQVYRDAQDTPLWRMVSKLASGRSQNTITEKTNYFDTSGKCLICHDDARHIASTTIGSGRLANSIMLTLCDEHVEQANKSYLIDFLLKMVGSDLQVNIVNVTTEKMLSWAEEAVVALGCKVEKRNPEKCEVTGVRPSGFKVILRCEAASNKNSYAYMILDPAGTNVGRIDDARDHPEQPIQWDHRHLSIPGNNKLVEPSFTFGMPLFDFPAIQRELGFAEAKLDISQY